MLLTQSNQTYFYYGSRLKGRKVNDTVENVMPNAHSKLGIMTLDNDTADLFDNITVSKYLNPEPALKIGKEEPVGTKRKRR